MSPGVDVVRSTLSFDRRSAFEVTPERHPHRGGSTSRNCARQSASGGGPRRSGAYDENRIEARTPGDHADIVGHVGRVGQVGRWVRWIGALRFMHNLSNSYVPTRCLVVHGHTH